MTASIRWLPPSAPAPGHDMRARLRRAMLIALALLPGAVAAAPQGNASLNVTGAGVSETASGADAVVQLVQHLDLDGDGGDESVFRAEAQGRWSFQAGVLNLGSRVAIFGRRLPFATAGHFASAYVNHRDTVQFTSALLPAGAPMTVRLRLDIHGARSDPWGRHIATAHDPEWLPPEGGASVVVWGSSGFLSSGPFHGDRIFEPELQVFNGEPMDLTIELYAEQRAPVFRALNEGYPSIHGAYASSGELDFLHTLRLGGLSAVDADGTALGDLAMWSSDGTRYLASPSLAPIPEPATWVLLAGGLAMLLLRRGRRGATRLLLPGAAAAVLALPAAALPVGGVGVSLRGDFERMVASDLTAVSATLSDAIDTDGDGVADGHYRGRGEAHWSFAAGVLRMGADLALSTTDVPVQPAGFLALAFATVIDRVQVWSPTLPAATPLVLHLGLHVSDQAHACDACAIAGDGQWLPPLGGAWVSVSKPGGVARSDRHWQSFDFATDIAVLNGVPFDLGISLNLELRADHAEAGRRGWDVHSTQGRLDYLHTLTVSALDVTAGGLGVADAALYGSSGERWLALSPVPEPSAALLSAGGLLVLVAWRRRASSPISQATRTFRDQDRSG